MDVTTVPETNRQPTPQPLQYRTINHFLIELTDEVAEFENLLWNKKENNFVRYVTKYKKDLANAISFFNIKIIGCLNDKILNLRFKQ